MTKPFAIKLISYIIFFLLLFLVFVRYGDGIGNGGIVEGISSTQTTSDFTQRILQVKVISGNYSGKEFAITDIANANTKDIYKIGDKVMLTFDSSNGSTHAYIADWDRRRILIWLTMLFIILISLIAGRQGILSILGLLFSLSIILLFIIPRILNGNDPFSLSLLASLAIIPVTYLLSHGLYKKTWVAIVSSIAIVGFIALISDIFMSIARLSNIVPSDALQAVSLQHGSLDLKSIFLAGIVIGGIAVLNDITISQASVVATLVDANPQMNRKSLFSHGMRVGKDHIASMVNTLVLVYIGASLTSFLLVFQPSQPFIINFNSPVIAMEMVRTLCVSMGIVLAVPITTLFAAFVMQRKN